MSGTAFKYGLVKSLILLGLFVIPIVFTILIFLSYYSHRTIPLFNYSQRSNDVLYCNDYDDTCRVQSTSGKCKNQLLRGLDKTNKLGPSMSSYIPNFIKLPGEFPQLRTCLKYWHGNKQLNDDFLISIELKEENLLEKFGNCKMDSSHPEFFECILNVDEEFCFHFFRTPKLNKYRYNFELKNLCIADLLAMPITNADSIYLEETTKPLSSETTLFIILFSGVTTLYWSWLLLLKKVATAYYRKR